MTEAAAGAAVLEARDLRRSYAGVSGPDLDILRGVDLRVDRGEAVAIVGASGSGSPRCFTFWAPWTRPPEGR